MARILIIDDEENICVSLAFALEDLYQVEWRLQPQEGLELLEEKKVDLVLLDLRIGSQDGILVLRRIKKRHPALPVIIMTGYGSIRSSVEAIKEGAYHYISKPIEMEELRNLIEKALEHAGLSRQVQAMNRQLAARDGMREIIGQSPAMHRVLGMIDKVKDIHSPVLLTGESGTGKELAARAIHFGSVRKEGPFEAVNCSAIPSNLLESAFFGHKKGAFTGADSDRKGKFELCQRGTLFLDEIGEMEISLQAKLLRVLQEREVTPVGGNRAVKVDVRVIAATNKDLERAMEAGEFREDLYYRLGVIHIPLPSLRERVEDIPLLAEHFVQKYNRDFNKSLTGITAPALRVLENHPYKGNVRELENMIARGVALAEGRQICPEDLPDLWKRGKQGGNAPSLAGKTLEEIERTAILQTLAVTGGNKTRAAMMLGVSDRTLRNKLDRYHSEGTLPQSD